MIVKNGHIGKTLVVLLCFSASSLWARVHEFETARLKSQGGAGIGSILLNESVVLNPAPLAVFNETTATYQRENLKLEDRNSSRDSSPNSFPDKTHNNALIVAEGSSKVKGSAAYIDQVEGKDKRQRVGTTVAAHLTDTTTLGMKYNYTKDQSPLENNGDKFRYHSLGAGLTHFYSNNLTFGLLMEDVAKSKADYTRGGIGIQYVAQDLLTLMVDFGADYTEKISKKQFYKAGAQFKIVQDLYIRSGMFVDKISQERGFGFGGGWVGPKLDLEVGMRTFRALESPSFSLFNGETQKELAASLSFIF